MLDSLATLEFVDRPSKLVSQYLDLVALGTLDAFGAAHARKRDHARPV